MVCFVDTYWVRYTTEFNEVLPPVDYVLYWVKSVHRWGDYYSCIYSNRYPVSQQ